MFNVGQSVQATTGSWPLPFPSFSLHYPQNTLHPTLRSTLRNADNLSKYLYIIIYGITYCMTLKLYYYSAYLSVNTEENVNPLAPEFFLILAHPVCKMWIIREPKKVALWNKRHFEEKRMENVQHVQNIQYVYLLTKYIKCNVWRLAVRYDIYIYIYIYIYVVRRLRVNYFNKLHRPKHDAKKTINTQ
jgi:hypothetical protein